MRKYSIEKKLQLLADYLKAFCKDTSALKHDETLKVLECKSGKDDKVFAVVLADIDELDEYSVAIAKACDLVGRTPREAVKKYADFHNLHNFAKIEMELTICGIG